MYIKINQANSNTQQFHNLTHQNYKPTNQSILSYHPLQQANFNQYGHEKENSVRDTNLQRQSPRYEDEGHERFAKSMSSNQQTTHPKTSTDNLHAQRLESIVLELQKTLDQQQYEIETLTDESTHYMNLCQDQKEVLINFNIKGIRSQYEQQIKELLDQKQKVEEIISRLQQEYNEVYNKQQIQLNAMRMNNDEVSRKIEAELEKKKCMISLLERKNKQLLNLEVDQRQSEERLDQLRNIERKLIIGQRELQAVRFTKPTKSVSFKGVNKEKVIREENESAEFASPIRKNRSKEMLGKSQSKSNAKYQYQFLVEE